MSNVSLEINGNVLSGWKNVSISRSLGSVCGTFSLGLLDSWNATNQSWLVKPFSSCKVLIDKDVVLTGYVDQLSANLSTGGTEINASGRDKTGDIVDCADILKNYELSNINVSQLARKLIKNFGIEYIQKANPGKVFSRVSINPGTRISSILEEYAKYRGLFFMTDNLGRLVLVSPGDSKASVGLIYGKNVKSVQYQYETQQRFSKYSVIAQTQGDPGYFGAQANQVEGKSVDPGVTRYRPMQIVADLSATISDSKKRAQWEASVRAARSESLGIDVVGWRQGSSSSSPLWEINSIVTLDVPNFGIKGEYLITSVSFSLDVSGGTTTSLRVERIDAYKAEPLKDPSASNFVEFFGD